MLGSPTATASFTTLRVGSLCERDAPCFLNHPGAKRFRAPEVPEDEWDVHSLGRQVLEDEPERERSTHAVRSFSACNRRNSAAPALDTFREWVDHLAPMNTQATNVLKREAIIKLLTDAEVARVSTAEGAPRLVEGDEYVDLEDLDSGVQLVQATPRTAPGRALARSAVSDATWAKIVLAVAS